MIFLGRIPDGYRSEHSPPTFLRALLTAMKVIHCCYIFLSAHPAGDWLRLSAGTITHLYLQILLAQVPGDTADRTSDIVLDVGSNLGFYSLLPARLGFPAIAFDMQAPPLCARCRMLHRV